MSYSPVLSLRGSLRACCQVSLGNLFPVDDFPNLLHEVWSHVLVVNVVGMLPDVNSQKGDKIGILVNQSILVCSLSVLNCVCRLVQG